MNLPQTLDAFSYPVMEHFYTVQGEGVHSGKPAYFVRLGGCDVGCVWCDVKESWPMDSHSKLTIAQLVEEIKKTPAKQVVVTGGEPSLYPLTPFCNALIAHELACWIETSGTGNFSGIWDWICVSPKKFKAPKKEWLEKADELKLVVFHPSDLIWVEQFLPFLKPQCRLIVQPEWDKREQIMPLLVNFVKENPNWSISLQSHKYLGIP